MEKQFNKLGGAGSVEAMAIKTAKPDGYTSGCISISTAFVAPFSEGAPYKDLTGFEWIVNYVMEKLEDAFAKAKKDHDFIQVMNRMVMPIIYMYRAALMKHVEKTFLETAKIYEKVKKAEEPEEKK